MNYKITKITKIAGASKQYLQKLNVPQHNMDNLFNYLDSLPKNQFGFMMKKIKENPDIYENEDFPDNLKQNKEILKARLEGWIQQIIDYPEDIEQISDDLKDNPEILKIVNQQQNLTEASNRLWSSAFNNNFIGKIS